MWVPVQRYRKSSRVDGDIQLDGTFSIIHTIDSAVDESLFDLSEYEILKKQ